MSKRKRAAIFAAAVIIILGAFASCASGAERIRKSSSKFTGVVYSAAVDYIFINVDEDDPLCGQYPVIKVTPDVEYYEESVLNLVAGDRVTVYYDEIVVEDGIPQPSHVYMITLDTTAE